MFRSCVAFSLTFFLSESVVASSEPSVVIASTESNLDPIARRVEAELKSAGRDSVSVRRPMPDERCPAEPSDEGRPGQVGIVLRSEGEDGIVAEICAKPRANQMALVVTRGNRAQAGDFSIVVTEALHGLLSHSNLRPEAAPDRELATKPSEDPRVTASDEHRRGVVLSLGTGVVVDARTADFWAGMVPRVDVPLSPRLGFFAEMFLGLRPIQYSDAEMELKSHLFWTRVGLMGGRDFGPAFLGWNVSVGPFANRATAEALAPREGGSDSAFGAVLQAGGLAEFPARGPVFLRAAFGLSTLVPRLDYQMSDGPTPRVGELLLEGGLGMGIRFGRSNEYRSNDGPRMTSRVSSDP